MHGKTSSKPSFLSVKIITEDLIFVELSMQIPPCPILGAVKTALRDCLASQPLYLFDDKGKEAAGMLSNIIESIGRPTGLVK